jgi:hypothetical protein
LLKQGIVSIPVRGKGIKTGTKAFFISLLQRGFHPVRGKGIKTRSRRNRCWWYSQVSIPVRGKGIKTFVPLGFKIDSIRFPSP